jgi:glucokinase
MSNIAVLVVDLGGTSMKGAVVAENGRPVEVDRRTTPRANVVDALVGQLHDLNSVASRRGYHVVGAGVVTPGIIDEDAGVVRYASNLDWSDLPLRSILSSRLGIEVAIGHDVRAAGLAEHLLGAARGYDDFALVTIGTGVAAALITGGHMVTGVAGAAGEFGHIPMVPGGEECTCGQRGCLEVYMSGAGLTRRYAAHGGAALSSAEIAGRVEGSDPIADLVWRDAVAVLAQGLATITLLLDPGVIVLGGGIAGAGDTLLGPLGRALADGLAWRESPPILLSPLRGEAGRIGASVLAFRNVGYGSVVEAWQPASTFVTPG